MAQFSTGIVRICLLLLLAWPSYSSVRATVTLEELQDQLQNLRENYIKFKEHTEAKNHVNHNFTRARPPGLEHENAELIQAGCSKVYFNN
uniref:Uncharacterized protein n=1 Tax=Daphnia galeata TaxID=27404 RepID=A0A8J2RVS1_9CRUS|nr:unnamed protein product [Daphnia galeata]